MRKLALAALAATLGCGEGGETIYLTMAVQYTEPGQACYKDQQFPDTRETAGFAAGAFRWVIFSNGEDKWYLDVEKMTFKLGEAPDVDVAGVFEGTRTEDKFTFSGKSTEVTKKPADPFTTTITHEPKFDLELIGNQVKGTLVVTVTQSCEGTCANDFPNKNPSCSVTHQLSGVRPQVDEAVLVVAAQ